MSYEEKYRRRALEYWESGHSKKETAAVFKVGTTTLQTWKSQLNESGALAPKKRKETWRKIDPEKLKEYLERYPSAYLREIAQEFACSENSVFKALKRSKITRKKNHNLSREQ